MRLRVQNVSYGQTTKVALVDERGDAVWEISVLRNGRDIQVRNNQFAVAVMPDVTNTIEIHERP